LRCGDLSEAAKLRVPADEGGGGLSLHYGDPQIAIGVIFAVLALLLATAFVVIAVQAGSEVGFERR
jgi:hypothetical protein